MRKLILATLLLASVVTPIAPAQIQGGVSVYIIKTGAKYHVSSSRYLAISKIAITLSKAKKQGYGACSVCRPPAR